MKPEFRIKQNKNGNFEVYYVEKKATIFKKEVLKPFVCWAGIDKVYEFGSIDSAIRELKQEVIKQTQRVLSLEYQPKKCKVCGQYFDEDDECPTGHRQT